MKTLTESDKMRKLINLISESLSPIVYHATDFFSAEKILETNTLVSRSGKISTTRSLTGTYHRDNKIIGVIFELDGTLLNQRYKSAPVGTEDWYYDDDDEEKVEWTGKENGQLEDRIYTHEIKPFIKYVKSAILFLPKEYIQQRDSDKFDTDYAPQMEIIVDVLQLLANYRIPTRSARSEASLYDKRPPRIIPGNESI